MGTETKTISAGVNTRALFANLANWFASSLSVIGELMQNGRRAGATCIDIRHEGDTLVVSDDGAGVSDFAVLLQFVESGWKDEATIRENPFGMGFFSTLYSAEAVTVQSGGKKLVVRLADVLGQTELTVENDQAADRVERGTRVTLLGLKKNLHDIPSAVRARARGFAIAVRYNGEDMPQPDAMRNLAGEQTPIGFISIPQIHAGKPTGETALPQRQDIALYLQGLPIGKPAPYASAIVHLDDGAFIARMPDRDSLRDHEQALRTIAHAMLDVVHQHLRQQKATLAPEEFLRRWAKTAMSHSAMRPLLDDIPLVPRSILWGVGRVCRDSDQCTCEPGLKGGNMPQFVPRQAIESGELVVWANAPMSAGECDWATALLKVMQRNAIVGFENGRLGPDHWLHGLAHDAATLSVSMALGPERGRTRVEVEEGYELVMVEHFTVTVADDRGQYRLDTHVVDDWTVAPDDTGNDATIYITPIDASPDCLANALSSYTDEYDRYVEEWFDAAVANLDALISGMKGLSPAGSVQEAINSRYVPVLDSQKSDLVLVRATRLWRSHLGAPGALSLRASALDAEFFALMAINLGAGVSAAALEAAFVATANPGELLGVGDEATEIATAFGLRVQFVDKHWCIQSTNESPGAATPADANHYATDRDAITAACERALAAAAAHHGLSVEALKAMPFEQRYDRVHQARSKPVA